MSGDRNVFLEVQEVEDLVKQLRKDVAGLHGTDSLGGKIDALIVAANGLTVAVAQILQRQDAIGFAIANELARLADLNTQILAAVTGPPLPTAGQAKTLHFIFGVEQ